MVFSSRWPATGTSEDARRTSPAAQAIAYLNQQRAANGIPPVTLDESLLLPTCTALNHEIAAGAEGTQFTADSSPWDDASFHQETLYNPSDASAALGGGNEATCK